MPQELYEIEPKENRQSQIEALDIGDSVAIARRIELEGGLASGAITRHNERIRGILDQQTGRARRRLPQRKFKVENGSFTTREGALIVTAVCTRVE